MDSPSPPSSAISSSSSDSESDHEPAALDSNDSEHGDSKTDDEEEQEKDIQIFRTDIPRMSRSASPLELKEERCPGEDYPLSQRVYSSPSSNISTGLHPQCCELWEQFDSIGTEMIVTRRGR